MIKLVGAAFLVGSNECITSLQIGLYDISIMTKIFHPLLALIASATDSELAKYVEYLKHENMIMRAWANV